MSPLSNPPNPATLPAALLRYPAPSERKGLTKKEIVADHPTWCPGLRGLFRPRPLFQNSLKSESFGRRKSPPSPASVARAGFPTLFRFMVCTTFMAVLWPLPAEFRSRPDLHVFVFGGDGADAPHWRQSFQSRCAKVVKLTCVVMDNWVYGLTKKQTSPTSPLGFKSKTDVSGAMDYPINPMKPLPPGRLSLPALRLRTPITSCR